MTVIELAHILLSQCPETEVYGAQGPWPTPVIKVETIFDQDTGETDLLLIFEEPKR